MKTQVSILIYLIKAKHEEHNYWYAKRRNLLDNKGLWKSVRL